MSQNKRQKPKAKPSKPAVSNTHLTAVDDAIVAKAMDDPEFLERAVNRLPPEVIAVAASRMTMHRGPIPDPETLIKYNHAQKDAANRIITMAEEEQRHRHRTDNKRINFDFSIKLVGQIFGLLSVAAVLGLSGALAYLGHPGAAATTAGTVTASLAAVFVLGQKYKAKQIKAKSENPENQDVVEE